MVDVFISYSRANQQVVRQLAEKVKGLGYSVWWDDELPPHLSYSDVITDKIGSARAAIVVWSEDAASSEWVRAEADVARNQKKLIQTSIDDKMPPMPFNQIQFASIGDWHGEDDHPGWKKVKASLEALCGPEAPTLRYPIPSTPPPAAPPPAAPAPAPAAKAGSKLVPALIACVVLVALAGFYLLFARGDGTPGQAPVTAQAAPAANQSAAAPTPAPAATEPDAAAPITDAQFTEAATVDAPAEIRSGPAADAFVVASVARGALVTTFPQSGDWWQVRAPNGAVGYLPHNQFRVLSTAAAASATAAAPPPPRPAAHPAPAPAPPPQATAQMQPVRPAKTGGPTPQQIQNMRRFCNGGPGQGTPQCIQFHQRMAARQRTMRGGY
jgi:hypothetical protein